jgi:hypothetical protein
MDFFERWFHFAPDGGDGTREAAYLAFALVLVSASVTHLLLRKCGRRGLASDRLGAGEEPGRPGPG